MATTQTGRPGQRWFTVLDGHRMRRLRRQRGLSRKQLAARAGISPATVGRLERRPAAPCRSRTLGRLAAALGEEPGRLSLPERPRTLVSRDSRNCPVAATSCAR